MAKATPGGQRPAPTVKRRLAADLERNLREQITAQERLLASLERQRASVGRLAGEDLTRALEEASAAVNAIAQLQAERRGLLEAGVGTGPAKGGPASPAEDTGAPASAMWAAVLDRLPAASRDRLAALRRRARDLAERVARANGINRRLSERASAHFGGLLETLAGGGSATYAPRRRGCVAVGPSCASALIDRVA
jgi:flagellar biosynthesis/type III secretory pathway chaperone